MKSRTLIFVLLIQFFVAPTLFAFEASLQYYLPENSDYDEQISTPESVLGFQVGQLHARHDQIIRYMEQLAEQSDRVSVINI
ncbi:MAG: hypothetical protein DRQ47_08670, partial [Gammaproteobacteria bacterium]